MPWIKQAIAVFFMAGLLITVSLVLYGLWKGFDDVELLGNLAWATMSVCENGLALFVLWKPEIARY